MQRLPVLLSDTREAQAIFQISTSSVIVCDSAAASASCISRAKHYGITDRLRELHAFRNGVYHLDAATGLDLFQRVSLNS